MKIDNFREIKKTAGAKVIQRNKKACWKNDIFGDLGFSKLTVQRNKRQCLFTLFIFIYITNNT